MRPTYAATWWGKDLGSSSSGFGVFSLNGAYRVTPRQVKLSAGVDNLLDKTYSRAPEPRG